MATNNYFGFPHGATQYGTTATGTAYSTPQTGYAVAPAPAPAAASYGTARPAGYDQPYQTASAPGTYATTATAATYDYGYGRTTQTYDTSKTYYQQAPGATAAYTAPTAYDASGSAAKVIPTFQTPHSAAFPNEAIRTTLQPAKSATQYQPAQQQQPPQHAAPAQTQSYVPALSTGYSQTVTTVHSTPKSATIAGPVAPNNSNTYSNYDAALYSAATMYVAQQQQQQQPHNNKAPSNVPGQPAVLAGTQVPSGAVMAAGGAGPGIAAGGASWQGYKNSKMISGGHGAFHSKARKAAPKPMFIHYCDVCKISCAGPQTYREHLEGQKHKKRELLMKQAAEPGGTAPARPPNSLHCELCGVTCTGNDAYAAHVRGAKHQKVVKLHTKLGKPIPACDPTPNADEKKDGGTVGAEQAGEGSAVSGGGGGGGGGGSAGGGESLEESVRPVGSEFIEEIKDEEGKLVSFSCKLCECKFNDPNAKEMHMKGRRHRLQYKKKVQPDLVVDIKPTVKQKKIAEARAHRQAMQEEFWNRRRMADAEMEDDHGMRTFGRHPFFGMLPGRRPESSDDRHVVARHAEIYPKEEELQTIQRIVSHTERALKLVSDVMTSGGGGSMVAEPTAAGVADGGGTSSEAVKKQEAGNEQSKEQSIQSQQPSTTPSGAAGGKTGQANQMISFHKEAEGPTYRLLKGVMRVGLLAKGLLLHGDDVVQLVMLCEEKPTTSLLKRVATELPIQLKKIAEDHRYTVTMAPVEGAVLVTDGTMTVKISLTSPLLREVNASSAEQAVQCTEDLLPREPCLQALAALRHAKWFQARATGLQSCVMIMRIMRDLCQRIPIWGHMSQWAMELLIEKIISSAGDALTPGECLRRVMEAISSAILINGPGLLDPCEKETEDALAGMTKQQREDITVSAQMFLRYIAFRQIYKVLGIDPLPPPKFAGNRNWRFNRKRRRSGTEGNENEADGKMVKKEESTSSSATGAGSAGANNANTATAMETESSK